MGTTNWRGRLHVESITGALAIVWHGRADPPLPQAWREPPVAARNIVHVVGSEGAQALDCQWTLASDVLYLTYAAIYP
jgi:hypothetical protein